MGFVLSTQAVNGFLRDLREKYRVVAPVRFEGGVRTLHPGAADFFY